MPICFCQAQGLFLSTPSVGRATKLSSVVSPCFAISIHALRGEGDIVRNTGKRFEYLISIHALRGEGDDVAVGGVGVLPGFLSTPSVGRATFVANGAPCAHVISIHALRGEGDSVLSVLKPVRIYFYPRPPWGGRQPRALDDGRVILFLSTPSVGRATSCSSLAFAYIGFLSTPSVGRATAKVHKNPVQLLRKGYNHFPAGRRNPPRSGKTTVSTFNNLAAKC